MLLLLLLLRPKNLIRRRLKLRSRVWQREIPWIWRPGRPSVRRIRGRVFVLRRWISIASSGSLFSRARTSGFRRRCQWNCCCTWCCSRRGTGARIDDPGRRGQGAPRRNALLRVQLLHLLLLQEKLLFLLLQPVERPKKGK